jgi:hypothetical protein
LNQAPARLEVEDLQENLRAVQEHLQHDRPKAELRAQLDRLHAVLWVVETGTMTEQQASEAAARLELAGASPFGVAVVQRNG